MERIFEKIDIPIGKKSNKLIISKCINCGSVDVIPVKSVEHMFGDVVEKHDGVLCNNCGCFHYIDGDNITYEYSYQSNSIDKKTDWNISDN